MLRKIGNPVNISFVTQLFVVHLISDFMISKTSYLVLTLRFWPISGVKDKNQHKKEEITLMSAALEQKQGSSLL